MCTEKLDISEVYIEQQKKQIVGNVKDNNGLSIIGANIVEAGTTNGTVTDMDGNFTLSVEEDAVLHISFIGYYKPCTYRSWIKII